MADAIVPTRQVAREINDCHTEVLVQAFQDRMLVLVTQLNKVGCLIQATIPPTAPLLLPLTGQLPAPSLATVLTPLFGSPPTEHLQDLYSLFASQIAALIWHIDGEAGPRKPVIVGVALQRRKEEEHQGITERERGLFNSVMDMIQECYH